MTDLTSTERRALRARAHHLHPVVVVGNAGLTAEVLREIEGSLKSHELIKIRSLDDDRVGRADLATAICKATRAQPVQQIGKILVIYRARPPEERKSVQSRPRRRPPRKTKRSFQSS